MGTPFMGMGVVFTGMGASIPTQDALIPVSTAFIPGMGEAIPGMGVVIPARRTLIPGFESMIPVHDVPIPGMGAPIPPKAVVMPWLLFVSHAPLSDVRGSSCVVPYFFCMTPPSTAHDPMTVEEWGALDEEVLGELVDGRLVDEEEGSLVDAVHTAPSIVAVSDCPGGVPRIVLASGVKFVIGPRTGRRADGSIYFAGGQPEPC